MAERLLVKAKTRKDIGGSDLKRMRKAGKIPAVLYGKGKSVPLEMDAKELVETLNKGVKKHKLLDVEVEQEKGGTKHLALVKEIQQDSLNDKVLHMDLHEVDLDQKVKVQVPVRETGVAPGVKQGGDLSQFVRFLKVETTPRHLPESIDVDVSGLNAGEKLQVMQVKFPEGVKCISPADLTIFSVSVPRVTKTEQTEGDADKKKKKK